MHTLIWSNQHGRMSPTEPVAKPGGEYILVSGCVYRKIISGWRGRTVHSWLRTSIPPDMPGRAWTRSCAQKWPVKFDDDRLPEHEVVDHLRAEEIIQAGLSRLRAHQEVAA